MAKNDITGQKFGRLTAISETRKEKNKSGTKSYWLFKCDCGNIVEKRRDCVVGKGETKSCGCLKRELDVEKCKKLHEHDKVKNESKTPLFYRFNGAKQRCTNPNHKNYPNYGGRGIKFEWEDFAAFKEDMSESFEKHVKEHGLANTTLERIDVNGNYCAKNCKWATRQEQSNNRRSSVYVLMEDGNRITLKDYADKTGFKYSAVNARYNKSKYNGTGEVPEAVVSKCRKYKNKKDNTEVTKK